MHTVLMVILLFASIFMIVSILLQSSKSDGLSGAIAGGAEQLFGRKKSNTYDAMLSKVTTVSSIAYIILTLVIVTIFN
ncbi:preprotein translocase subunit SecG [Clostridiales Family XIII bacterium RF-744-FAT-WT-3]|uniref:Protein-export membrane protein SecG n=1 Tax=Baileyella intestinalis TaxID=2606709 RepID=A0A6A8M709_9FIRM|nr:preprotein translocase subunit SecG [Baileyella intestinalis]MST69135.1 preprotein translocase subunit SecG [Baileyella intestinalis]